MKTEEQLDSFDLNELKRLKRVVTPENSFRLDRDIHRLKDMNMYELHFYDPLQVTIINTFQFSDEDAAKIAAAYADSLDSGPLAETESEPTTNPDAEPGEAPTEVQDQ